MRHIAGQAARGCAVILHRVAGLALLVVVLGLVGLGGLSWRLSQGPLNVPWLAHRIEAAANDGVSTHLTVGTAALAWEGFRSGVDRPLDLRLTGMVLTDRAGLRLMELPRAEVSLSIGALLLGRILPRAVVVNDLELHLLRTPDGAIHFDRSALSTPEGAPTPPPQVDPATLPRPEDEFSSAVTLLRELGRPPTNDRGADRISRLSQLRRVVIRQAALTVVDTRIGATWQAKVPLVDLARSLGGGVHGTAEAVAMVGDQSVPFHLSADVAQGARSPGGTVKSEVTQGDMGLGGGDTRATLAIGAVTPASLARTAPGLALLAAVDAPVETTATIGLGPDLALKAWRIDTQMGAGSVGRTADTMQKVEAASLLAEGNGAGGDLRMLRVQARGRAGGPLSTLQVHGPIRRVAGQLQTDMAVELDHADFADLAQLWPEGVGRDARAWILENITAGIAHDARVTVSLEAPEDLSHVALTGATGTLDGSDLTVHWLRPVPPIESGQARLRIIDPDNLEIVVQSGRQRIDARRGGANAPGIAIKGGVMRITGVAHKDQFAEIEGNLAGSVPDTLTLLKNPRLQLLSKHPMDLREPQGQVAAKLDLHFPLEHTLTVEQVVVHTVAKLDDVHLTSVVLGRDLGQGTATLDATTDALKVDGQAVIGGIPSQLGIEMDFRPGPASQVVQKITVSGRPNAQQLDAAGLSVGHAITGTTGLQAVVTERRDGQGQMELTADLTETVLTAGPLEWRKPAGVAASGRATVRMNHDRLLAIEGISVEGDGLSLRGRADPAPGGVRLQLDRLALGRSEASGTIFFPDKGNGPAAAVRANVTGPTIDLSARLTRRASPQPKGAQDPDAVGQPWAVEARFERALMGEGRTMAGIVLDAESDGQLLRRLHLEGRTAIGGFRLDIVPERGGRRLTGSANDAGSLLSALDISQNFRGGALTISGTYDDRSAGHPLTGTADITGFRLQNAPGIAKLLQAMTLYGLVEALRGPGLEFNHLVAPFTLSEDILTLREARAFNASLGLTAKGTVDLARDRADIEGTIVPAYFFNSLLGRVPLLGRLFSPETGGGVFAANYTMRGPLADPQVTVNPLSALTPGFLRGLFNIF